MHHDLSHSNLIILCASYFDRLGHPIYANKVAAELAGQFEGRIEIRGIAISEDSFSSESPIHVVPVPVWFGSHFTINARSVIIRRYGRIGLLFNGLVRLVAVTNFYWKAFRAIKSGTIVIDLECEPIQVVLAAAFMANRTDIRMGLVIHSMPSKFTSPFFRLYKYMSVLTLRLLVNRAGRRAIFMNSPALESAVNKGIKRHKCILGGWGYDLNPQRSANIVRSVNGRTVILAFGVIRKDKRIEQLVDRFLELDDSSILLRILGKSIDVDVPTLIKRIGSSSSSTLIEISDRFVDEAEIPELFSGCDMVVLSHSAGFESMSGPMFLAIQYARPILCFSGHTVAALVQESGAGIVLRLEDESQDLSYAIAKLRDWRYDQKSLERFTWGAIANRMVDW